MLLNLAGTGLGLSLTLVGKKIIDDAGKGLTVWQLLLSYLGIVLIMEVVDVIITLISTMLNEKFSFGIKRMQVLMLIMLKMQNCQNIFGYLENGLKALHLPVLIKITVYILN